jgi:hypothetical protein
MYFTKDKKLVYKITFSTFCIVFSLIYLSIFSTGHFFQNHFSYEFKKGIENKIYLTKTYTENSDTFADVEKKLESDYSLFDPNNDYLLKVNGKIKKIGFFSKQEESFNFLKTLKKWDWYFNKIWERTFYFYNDKKTDKIFVTNFFINEIQAVLYEFFFYFTIVLIFPIYFISRKIARLTIEPIEEANKILTQYNHNLAHEIKTPISAVLTSFDLLKIWYDKELIYNSKKELKGIVNIIDSLLELTQKNMITDTKEINIYNFLGEYKINAQFSENIKISWNKKNNIKTDEILFWRIVKNIVENAMKYSSDRFIFIEILNNSILFNNRIENNISQKEINKITTDFYQLDTSRNSVWYWLWLSIVKKISEVLWYKLEITSNNNIFSVKITF